MATSTAPYLHFWDNRDGDDYCSWWITYEIGSEVFVAFAPYDVATPASAAGGRDNCTLRHCELDCALLDATTVGVRAPLRGISGAYEVMAGHPHRHGEPHRPVYRWTRVLTVAEVDAIARLAGGDGSVDAQAALAWVGHVPESASAGILAPEAADDGETLQFTVDVAGEAALQTVVAKAAGSRLSIPELADDESPLPRGWVLAERGVDTCATVRDHLLEAVANLEHGVAAEVAALPEVREQVRRMKELADRGGFRLCVWG